MYALSVMQAPGAEFGWFFDQSALYPARLAQRAAPLYADLNIA